MAYERKPGTYSLFKNKDKSKETDRDYQGDGMELDGREVWLSAWINKTKAGETYMKITCKPKDEQRVPASRDTAIDLDDRIPF